MALIRTRATESVLGLSARFSSLAKPLTLPMLDAAPDDMLSVLRPHGAGLPRKGKGVGRKKSKPKAETEPAPTVEPAAGANTLATPVDVAPHPDVKPLPPRPTFVLCTDDATWEEVLTEVAPIPRPPSVPVRVTFTESKELPHWNEMPLETPGLDAPVDVSDDLAPATPVAFVPKQDAELLHDWFQNMELRHLEAAARAATAGLGPHVLLALPAEWLGARCRREAVLAKKVYEADGRLSGYELPRFGHERLSVHLPWPQHLPSDERNDTVRRIEFLGNKLRRLVL